MRQRASLNFGLTIAYLIPGFLTLAGLAPHAPVLASWLGTGEASGASLGGFLYGTLASLTAGLTVSTLRWLTIDQIHARTGLPAPVWDFRRLQENLDAFELAVEYHYRYYQFYANTLIALLFIVVGRWPLPAPVSWPLPVRVALFLAAVVVLFVASRDTLRKYYARASVLESPTSTIKET